jgi:hypothetical protein
LKICKVVCKQIYNTHPVWWFCVCVCVTQREREREIWGWFCCGFDVKKFVFLLFSFWFVCLFVCLFQ